MKCRYCTISTIAGLILTLSILSACSVPGGADNFTEKRTSIEVWTNNSSSKFEDLKMVYDFNSGAGKEKGIVIDYKVFGEEYVTKLQAALAADKAPVLFKNNISTSSIPTLVNAGWIVAIEDIPGGDEFLKKYKGQLQPVINTYNGKTYTVPFALTTMAVAYNKDLLKRNGYSKPPETWSEMREMAKTVTKNGRGKDFGFIEGVKSNIHSQNGLYQYFPAVGHDSFDPKKGRFNFSDFIPFYQLWIDMKNDGSIFPGYEALNNDQARSQFAEGNIAFKFSASYDVGVWKDQFPTKMSWGICRPVEDPAKRYKNYAYQIPSLVFGKKSLEMPEKTMEVFKLWNSDETLKKLYESGKYIPYGKDILGKDNKDTAINNWVEFADLSNTFISTPNPVGEIKLQGDNDNAVIQKIIRGQVGVEEGLKDLDRRYNEALDKAVENGLDLTPYLQGSDSGI